MGQGASAGLILGGASQVPLHAARANYSYRAASAVTLTAFGIAIDFASDATAREGKLLISDSALLHATETLKKVSTYRCVNALHPVAKTLRFQHEWLVLEAHQRSVYYTAQKGPNGDVILERFRNLRLACDAGLAVGGQPTSAGEFQHIRGDTDFLVESMDLQVAYIIAWMKKEDPRWSLTTENSRHFADRLRVAIKDF